MKRIKHHKVKKEKAESSSQLRVQEEHDLAYYIHDRVELMHQVFSILKYKELKSMAPECIRNLAIGDLEELCTEELLGISSKRLLAVLDGVEPPSDTESSSPSPPSEQLETISLDSISSDEELLSSSNKKKKHKHRRRSVKSKSKNKDKSKEAAPETEENSELSKASRAGLTVLELLELQARARAIRAQLQKEKTHKMPSETTAVESSHHSSENEVEIKEEPRDVVEISSEDEKPNIDQLEKRIVKPPSPKSYIEPQKITEIQENPKTVTKRINDLIITVPKATTTRKIKLNRNKLNTILPSSKKSEPAPIEIKSVTTTSQNVFEKTVNNANKTPEKTKGSKPKKKKRDKKKKAQEKDGSDHDEITLQLSDSEKMDLLEDLDESRKNYDKVSSSSEDTESSSSDSDNDIDNYTPGKTSQPDVKINSPKNNVQENEQNTSTIASSPIQEESFTTKKKEVESENNLTSITPNNDDKTETIFNTESATSINVQKEQNCNNYDDNINDNTNENKMLGEENEDLDNYNNPEDLTNYNLNKTTDTSNTCNETSTLTVVDTTCIEETSSKKDAPEQNITETVIEISVTEDITALNETVTKNKDEESENDSQKYDESLKESKQGLSDGELSDRQSSEIEAIDVQPEVVCISDEESPKKKLDKKKKKKEKKSKKEKKTKKSKLDFHEGSNQNFYKNKHFVLDTEGHDFVKFPTDEAITISDNKLSIGLESDDVYEILELSDDSSCYEVEGTVLSKEPTTEEIEALSARIDEIEREEVITDEQIREHEQMLVVKEAGVPNEGSDENIGSISWKERYLGSKKVKRVLTTANILNALRKKNKELKKKIQDSRKTEEKETTVQDEVPKQKDSKIQLEEGSIEQYNTLQGLTKYVDPVTESVEERKDENDTVEDNTEKCVKLLTLETDVSATNNVTKEMKKDAKQLLKMYKKLLKHNDMNKQKDPDKKKKKKQKKKDKQAIERL